MYAMMYIVLGGIYYCFGVAYYVLEVMYALLLEEHKFYLLLLKCTFDVMIDSGNYLCTASSVKPIQVIK